MNGNIFDMNGQISPYFLKILHPPALYFRTQSQDEAQTSIRPAQLPTCEYTPACILSCQTKRLP